jgi:hypothetical protein
MERIGGESPMTLAQPSTTLFLALSLLAPAGAGETRLAVVYLADGTSVPLQDWTLVYDYLAQPPGALPGQGRDSTRDSDTLWLGKKSYALRGTTLEVEYADVAEEREIQGEVVMVTVTQASGLKLTTEGKGRSLKIEPPARDWLRGDDDKDLSILPRGLDISGHTLAGTSRRFCLLSFHYLVECRPAAGDRVIKIIF